MLKSGGQVMIENRVQVWLSIGVKKIVEITAGEGGNDAKLLVMEQFNIYDAWARKNGVVLDIISMVPDTIG